jgi:hypothetical protein
MPRQPFKWRESRANRAAATLSEIEASVGALHAECLLDLHDIFREKPDSPLARLAEAEMERRGLKPQS